jgi:hypothetical protein
VSMSAEVTILVATAVLAVVAIGAAVIAVRAARRIARTASPAEPARPEPVTTTEVALREPVEAPVPPVLEPRIVAGRLVVPPSEQQVVSTALGRPGVRLSILVHGVAHALRPESRDRITAMMRRDYRQRRRQRLQAGRRAVRAGRPTPPSDQWLGS